MVMSSARTISLTAAVMALTMMLPPEAAPANGDGGLFHQVEIGAVSLGGRATYFDPKDGSGNWYGGAQLRLYPSRFFAIEGSADYRRNDFDGTHTHTYPVQVSALLYPLGTTRLAPFILGGGGWYYTTVSGPNGFSDTQNRFGLHAGGGLQFFLNRRWSIDGTYRYIWLEKVESRDQNIVNKNFQDNGHMVTIGLNFHF